MFCVSGSTNPAVLRWDPGRGCTRLPGRPSSGETVMNPRRHVSHAPKRRRRVSSVVLDAVLTGISYSPLGGVRNGEWAPASPGVHRRSGRRWTCATLQKRVHNHGEESSPRLCIAFMPRSAPPSEPGVEMGGERPLSPRPPPGETAMDACGDIKNC